MFYINGFSGYMYLKTCCCLHHNIGPF